MLFISHTNAQESYRSINGRVQITGIWNDSVLIARSNKLVIVLDYYTAKFKLKLDKSTLVTGIDSLDKKLKNLKYDYINYEGKLGIEYINTEGHPRMDFEVVGYLSGSKVVKIVEKGQIEHLFNESYPCILNMSFHIKLSDINLNINLPGLYDEIHIEIIQTILNRENEVF
jgi:hypothetical protein